MDSSTAASPYILVVRKVRADVEGKLKRKKFKF